MNKGKAIFAQVLISRERRLYECEQVSEKLLQAAYALDSTTIDLCLSLFRGARLRRRKIAIKLHTLMESAFIKIFIGSF